MSDGTVVVSDLGLAVSVEEAQKEGAVSICLCTIISATR
jgi:hypothetical protein